MTSQNGRLFLHNHPMSSYAVKVRIALREKGIPFDFATPAGLGSGSDIPTDFSSVNPRAEVPALVDGEFKIFDSKVIMEYLEDKYPDKPLLPKDAAARAKARLIQEVCDSHYEAINWGVLEVKVMERASGELAQKMIEQARSQTHELLSWLEKHLGDSEYFNGSAFGFADICVVPYLNRTRVWGFGPAEGSALQRWLHRVDEIPSVKETRDEMLEAMKGFAENIKDAFKPGTGRRREYRDHRLEWIVKSGGIDVVMQGLKDNTIRSDRSISCVCISWLTFVQILLARWYLRSEYGWDELLRLQQIVQFYSSNRSTSPSHPRAPPYPSPRPRPLYLDCPSPSLSPSHRL